MAKVSRPKTSKKELHDPYPNWDTFGHAAHASQLICILVKSPMAPQEAS